MSNLISQLPEDIKKVALEYQRNETKGIIYSKETDILQFAFEWSETKEKENIWNDVNNSNYQPFYDFHAKQKQTPEDWCKAKGYNEYFVMIIKQYLEDNG